MSQIGVWIWIWGHHKKREGNCLHCVRVQQRRLSWTDCTGCWPKDTGHNRWFVRLFQDTGLDDWATKLVVVCTDEAAVNMGMYNSVVLKLWQLAAVGDSRAHLLCPAHILENCLKSAEHNIPYWETFNRSVVKLLQFLCKKVEQKTKLHWRSCVTKMGSPLWNWASFIISGGLHGGMKLLKILSIVSQ